MSVIKKPTPYQLLLREHFYPEDELLLQLQREAKDEGLPAISIGPEQGKFLQMMVVLTQARKVLEIGTLGGYSGAWMGRALADDGKLISLELEEKHAAFARRQWQRMGLGKKMEVRVGPALETLPTLANEAPFDLVFIDADKESYPAYLEWSLRYSRRGTVILADNVELAGKLVDPAWQEEPFVQGMRQFIELASSDSRLLSTVLPYPDGLAMTIVTG
jgi:predicted O-methyltransferase YrrM